MLKKTLLSNLAKNRPIANSKLSVTNIFGEIQENRIIFELAKMKKKIKISSQKSNSSHM